jgi:hypothetical protein
MLRTDRAYDTARDVVSKRYGELEPDLDSTLHDRLVTTTLRRYAPGAKRVENVKWIREGLLTHTASNDVTSLLALRGTVTLLEEITAQDRDQAMREASELYEAQERVKAFLEARDAMSGNDPEVIYALGLRGHGLLELRKSDIVRLLDASS